MEKMDVPLLSRRESSLANNDLDDFDRTPVSTKGKGREREREREWPFYFDTQQNSLFGQGSEPQSQRLHSIYCFVCYPGV